MLNPVPDYEGSGSDFSGGCGVCDGERGGTRKMTRTKSRADETDDMGTDKVSAGDSGAPHARPPHPFGRSTALEMGRTRGRALALAELATLPDAGMLDLTSNNKPLNTSIIHSPSRTPKRGRIIILGCVAVHTYLVLADKLVQRGLLGLIPATQLAIRLISPLP